MQGRVDVFPSSAEGVERFGKNKLYFKSADSVCVTEDGLIRKQ